MRLLIAILSLISFGVFSQSDAPVKFELTELNDTLHLKANIDNGWHLYAVHLPNPFDGPLPTEISIDSDDVKISGDIAEDEGIREEDAAFGVEVIFFEHEANFYIPFEKVNKLSEYHFTVNVAYMVCNDESCRPYDAAIKTVLK